MRKMKRIQVEFLRDNVPKNSGAIVCGSGGCDSSTVTALCVEALNPNRVIALHMVTERTPHEETKLFELLMHELNIESYIINIGKGVKNAINMIPASKKITEKNPKYMEVAPSADLRYRELIAFDMARKKGYRYIGCVDRNELLTGRIGKYTCCGDITPLANNYRMQVKGLAYMIGIPYEIINLNPENDPDCPRFYSLFSKDEVATDVYLILMKDYGLPDYDIIHLGKKYNVAFPKKNSEK